ncbi:MAG: FliA/WhiG family RNA polymerase sigma factor [Tissierellaceae bacterium]|nr:FliA/WhiG family RNA polymerase sigma factor [Tissierellaceae bacterium]
MAYAYSEHENLIIKHLPLVKRLVSKMDSGYYYDLDDLVNIGVIGLMDAIKKYDKEKKVPFEAYATLRIKGAVIDELRRAGPVSRDRMSKLNQYYEAKTELERRNLRTPDEDEICEELGINEKELSKIHETVHYLSNVSLESTIFSSDSNDVYLKDVIEDDSIDSPEDILLKNERKQLLKDAISMLNEREQIILNLYYVEELSLKEIAYILGISTPRVSQIHGKILLKLRDILEG